MAMLIVVVFEHHDYILEHLARHAVRHARAAAARHRLALEARRAQEDTSPAAEQLIGPGSCPHVTLMQCAVGEAPRARVREFIARLEEVLRGQSIPLSAIVTFGAGFLFWCADPTGPGRRALQAAHKHAVTFADDLLDPVANAAVIEATIGAFGDERELVGNARRYGYALVRERYLPHVTLGFDPRLGGGDRSAESNVASRPHTTHIPSFSTERTVKTQR